MDDNSQSDAHLDKVLEDSRTSSLRIIAKGIATPPQVTTAEFDDLRPRRLRACEFRGLTSTGNSRPMYMDCEDDDGTHVKLVLKLRDPLNGNSGTPWGECITRDLVGSMIARRMNLEVPDYALVEIDSEFARSMATHPEHRRIVANIGQNFGSVIVDATANPDLARRSAWSGVLVFDCLGFNVDRKPTNPNVLWDGSRLILIDHALLAPTWTFAHDGVTSRSLYGNTNIRLHAGHKHLTGLRDTFDSIHEWPSRVTPEFLRWVRTVVPKQWTTPGKLDELFAFLGDRYLITSMQHKELTGTVQ